MTTKVGVIWEEPLLFIKFIEDCGHSCELVTTNMIVAPFFRKKYHGLIIPAGFGLGEYSRILIALRAISPKIRNYIRGGGTLVAFGAWTKDTNAYDWLPVRIKYQYHIFKTRVSYVNTEICPSILENGMEVVNIDGTFDDISYTEGSQVVMSTKEGVIMAMLPYGKGRIIVSTIHECPSREFIQEFCSKEKEGIL